MDAYTDELRAAYDAALRFANALRAADRREPLPALMMGEVGNCARCPVAATANMGRRSSLSQWEVGAVAVKVSSRGNPHATHFPVPTAVREFMAAFDAGAYPDLEARQINADLVMATSDGLGA